MPPLQDRSHMALLSSGWWSCIWIFYISKVNNVFSTLERILENWVYSNSEVVTCPLLYIYQSHQEDGLMLQREICPGITPEPAVHPAGCLYTALQLCVTCSPFSLIHHFPLFGDFQHLHQTFLPFTFLLCCPLPLPTIHLKGSLWWTARGNFEPHKAMQRVN